MVRPLHIKNAHVWKRDSDSESDLPRPVESDLFTDARGRICAEPQPDALMVELRGHTIFPGLINAHDHLELNHYPRAKFRDVYNNAHEWGEDVNARLDGSPFKELRAYPLKDRLFIGGLKNLLCGATMVAHHGPPHKPMFRKDFPARVLRKYGWAHSLHFDTDEQVVASYQSTPPDVPWFIHLAEGMDEVAAGEYQRLKALGCIGSNTVIVHGVGLTSEDIADAAPRVRGLVWCPTTNDYLLGQTASIEKWQQAGGNVYLGSDSRLTAAGDWLDELRGALYSGGSNSLDELFQFGYAAESLWCGSENQFAVGNHADFCLWGGYPSRESWQLVVRGGIPQIGYPDMMAHFPHIETVPATLDGVPKAINSDLARQIANCSLQEPGLTLQAKPQARHFAFLRNVRNVT